MISEDIESLSGEEAYKSPTYWAVHYEYADWLGGGNAVDYFRTANRYTPPTGPEVRRQLNGEERTVIAIDKVELYFSESPRDKFTEDMMPDDARHPRVYDLVPDWPGDPNPLQFGPPLD